MFDKLNEKRIYLDACFCGVVAAVLSLIRCFIGDAAFNGNCAEWIDMTAILIPYLFLVFYFGFKGLVPGLVAFIEWIVIAFVFNFVFYISGSDSGFALVMSKICILNPLTLFSFVSSVTSGLITTLCRKRAIAICEGLCLFTLLYVLFIF